MPNKIPKVSRKAPKPKRFTETELNNMKLHQLLGVAIKDACILKKSKKWKFNMGRFLSSNGVCTGCLAGAVLHRQLGLRKQVGPIPAFALALDYLRRGNVGSAAYRLSKSIHGGAYRMDRLMHDTVDFTLRLEKDLRKLQADLKKADL